MPVSLVRDDVLLIAFQSEGVKNIQRAKRAVSKPLAPLVLVHTRLARTKLIPGACSQANWLREK